MKQEKQVFEKQFYIALMKIKKKISHNNLIIKRKISRIKETNSKEMRK